MLFNEMSAICYGFGNENLEDNSKTASNVNLTLLNCMHGGRI